MTDNARILIVDDSRTFRAAIEDVLRGQGDLSVIGSVFSGAKALEFIGRHPPDLVTLDVEMPGMNGLETLQAIQQFNRTLPAGRQIGVLMVSAFTQRGGEVTMQALQAGAFDFVTKPSTADDEESGAAFRDDLLTKVRAYLARRRGRPPLDLNWDLGAPPAPPRQAALPAGVVPRLLRAVLIGASTGGPKALSSLLPELAKRIDAPIVIVQHMPAGFTRSLADNLMRRTPWPVYEGEDGQPLMPRTMYIAPGGKHLVLRGAGSGRVQIGLTEQPPESGCRPSASVLFRSAAALLGRETAAIILTGMGNDGTAGLASLKRAGGYVVAQDEESSVVWGMPGSAVSAGVTDAVLPLEEIANAVEAVSLRRSSP